MSVIKTVYIGKYLRVYMPKAMRKTGIYECPKGHGKLRDPYCPICGSENILEEKMMKINLYDFIEENFTDLYDIRVIDGNEYDIAVDFNETLIEAGEYDYPDSDFNDDLIKLMNCLDENNIRYEKDEGVIIYYD